MRRIVFFFSALISVAVVAGGRSEYVEYPAAYRDDFTRYSVQNRANNKQLAHLYANRAAVDSAASGTLAEGSVIVMEVHKPVVDDAGTPVADDDGLFRSAAPAAVAVMEKRSAWDAGYDANERAGDWGFAFYDPAGQPKDNDLDCAVCHQPLTTTDHMFSLPKLVEFSAGMMDAAP